MTIDILLGIAIIITLILFITLLFSLIYFIIKKKKIINYTSIILAVMFLIPFIYLATFFIGRFYQSPNSNTLGSADGWLSFTGAIVGGILTLVGVIITIKYQEEERKKLISLELKPILACSHFDTTFPIGCFYDCILYINNDTSNEPSFGFQFSLENMGRGEALIKNFDFEIIDDKNIYNFYKIDDYTNTKVVPTNKKITLICYIPYPKDNTVDTNYQNKINFKFIARYTDLLAHTEYQYSFVADFFITKVEPVERHRNLRDLYFTCPSYYESYNEQV